MTPTLNPGVEGRRLSENNDGSDESDEVRSPRKKVGQCRLWTPARLTELEEGHPNSRGIPPSASTYCIKMPCARLERNRFLISLRISQDFWPPPRLSLSVKDPFLV